MFHRDGLTRTQPKNERVLDSFESWDARPNSPSSRVLLRPSRKLGFIFFNLKDTSQIPAEAEPWFLAFDESAQTVIYLHAGQCCMTKKRAQRRGALAIPLPRRLHEILVTGKHRWSKEGECALVAETGRFPSRVNTWNPVPQNCRTRW